ncbi:hypothetical protein BC828DRAFT_379608 [Blastocladiella britannica]|nr:hypothetical protein BC828DRAFT_379608 [Blastocladiella britannica]
MPFKYTEYSLTAASGGGHVEILSWWAKAHTAHGLELKYTGAAIDDASAAGFTPVLEWWLSAASRYRLELRYSADAVNAAARARRWDVLAWWRRAAESNPSIITLKYDAAALTAQARSALGLPEPQPRPPTAPTPAALTPQHTGASYSAPPPRYSTAVGAPSVPSTPTAQQTTIYMVVAGDGQQQQQAPAAQPAEDAGINWRALLPWIIGLVILLIVFVSIFGAIGAVILGALVLYCCVKILC